MCLRGTTSRCVGPWGLMSWKATTLSSSYALRAGIRPATISQNRQDTGGSLHRLVRRAELTQCAVQLGQQLADVAGVLAEIDGQRARARAHRDARAAGGAL